MADLLLEFERLRPLTLEELADLPPRKMLIKGLLGIGEMSVFFGEPKCGKSFLVTHLGLAIAAGEPWFGKKVLQGPVLYVAAEGAGGFAKRIEAHRQHHGGIEGAPFHVIPTNINLLEREADVDPLIYWAEETGAKLIVIDTLSRAMPGGNENSPEHMTSFIANCDRIRETTGAHILIIHHKPKGNNNTPRGHSSLFGAIDALILVEKRKGGNVATVTDAKDDADGWTFGFNLEVVEVGADEDDEPITSCVVIEAEPPAKTTSPLNPKQRRAMEALHSVLADHRKPSPGGNHYPPGVPVVEIELWKKHLISAGVIDKDGKNPRQDFKRLKDQLTAKGEIAEWNGLIWAVKDGLNDDEPV